LISTTGRLSPTYIDPPSDPTSPELGRNSNIRPFGVAGTPTIRPSNHLRFQTPPVRLSERRHTQSSFESDRIRRPLQKIAVQPLNLLDTSPEPKEKRYILEEEKDDN